MSTSFWLANVQKLQTQINRDEKERDVILTISLFLHNHLNYNYFVASSDAFLKFLSSFSRASETFLALWPLAFTISLKA